MTNGDFMRVEDAEVISEGVDTEATVKIPVQGTTSIPKKKDPRVEQQIKEWQKMYIKMHTPFKRQYRKVGRNEICPFCDSGLKFKQCECSQTYGEQVSY